MENNAAQPAAGVLAREYPCPACGYDLRAAEGGRCPECGTVTPRDRFTTSRIPWAHRRTKGRLLAYFGTLRLLVRPAQLAKEMHARQKRRDADSFHRVSLVAAVLLATAFLLTASRINPRTDLPNPAAGNFWFLPALLLLDSWCLAIPLAIAFWISFRLIMAGYRAILRIAVIGDIERRRATMIGFYASGILPIQAACWGLLLVGLSAADADWPALQSFQYWFGFAGVAFPALGAAIYLILALTLAIKIGPRPWLRSIFIIFYGLLVIPLSAALLMTCLWLAGYTALALRMMTL